MDHMHVLVRYWAQNSHNRASRVWKWSTWQRNRLSERRNTWDMNSESPVFSWKLMWSEMKTNPEPIRWTEKRTALETNDGERFKNFEAIEGKSLINQLRVKYICYWPASVNTDLLNWCLERSLWFNMFLGYGWSRELINTAALLPSHLSRFGFRFWGHCLYNLI